MQSVASGSIVWKSGDFLAAEAAPMLITLGGQQQVVVLGGQSVNGLDPETGRVLWSHPHDTHGDMNNSMPVWGPDNILFVTSAYNQGSRALQLTRKGAATHVEELWFTNRFRLMFSNALRLGNHIYGTSGDFGPASARLVFCFRGCYRRRMTLKARVKAGRLVVDEPTDLPEGTEIELLALDPGDWLDEPDRAALHRALRDSAEDLKAGRLVDADVVLRQLRSR